eukprot:4055190-Pyramimonas_sp.AAC.1
MGERREEREGWREAGSRFGSRLLDPLRSLWASLWVTQKGIQLQGGGAINSGQLYCKCIAPGNWIA